MAQGRPALTAQQRFCAPDTTVARSLVGLSDLPTIVALGPFDDPAHAYQLAGAFTLVQRTCRAQLVLLGTGAYRSTVARYAAGHGLRTRVHLVEGPSAHRWSDLLAVADLVVPSTASTSTSLLDVLATGRAVLAPANAVSAPLLMPGSAGLVYRQGDVLGMAAALLRLLTTPALRNEIGTRAGQVARRHQQRRSPWQQCTEGSDYA
jgi:glycosyltransferase involved in cell wall biosynthesis